MTDIEMLSSGGIILTGKLKYWKRNMSQCHFLHHKYKIVWLGIQPRSLQGQHSNKPSDITCLCLIMDTQNARRFKIRLSPIF